MNHLEHGAHINSRDKSIFGFWMYIMSDCLLFASLFATFAVLRANTAGGAGAADLFSLPFVLSETLILLTSSFACGLAILSMHEGRKRATIMWLMVAAALGAAFVVLELREFMELVAEGHSWRASAFLSSFFTLVGTHGLHVSLGLIWMLVTMFHIYRRGFTAIVERRFMCLALFWHFLDIVWIFIFSFVYILPIAL